MRLKRFAVSTTLLVLLAAGGTTAGMRFVDATEGSGIRFEPVCGANPGDKGWLTEGMGSGGAWLDYDGDGNLDLYLQPPGK